MKRPSVLMGLILLGLGAFYVRHRSEMRFLRAMAGPVLGDSQAWYWIKDEASNLNPWTKVSGAYDYWTSRGVVGGLKEAAGVTSDTAQTVAFGVRGAPEEKKTIPWWVWALGAGAVLIALAPRGLGFARQVSQLQREHAREGLKLGREALTLYAGARGMR